MPTKATLDLSIQKRTIDGGFTQSELGMLDECALKWNYRYNNGLRLTGYFPWALWVGGEWHRFQENWRKTGGEFELVVTKPDVPDEVSQDNDWQKWFEYWSSVLPAMSKAYARLWRDEAKHDWFIVEEELSAAFLGYTIRGKIDLVSHKPRFMRDFKSTASTWLISPIGWQFSLQFMTYAWLMKENYPEFVELPFDFQLDMMQKPGLKETKGDGSWKGHIQRVVKDVQDPERKDMYYKRMSAKITIDDINRFEKNVLTPKIQRLDLAITNPEVGLPIVTNPNTKACHAFGKPCEFFGICEGGFENARFHYENQTTTKHEELD